MGDIEVKFEKSRRMCYATVEDGKKIIYINEILRGTFPGFLNSRIGHEKVHLKRKGGFLPDEYYVFGPERYKILRDLLRKYKFRELEELLNSIEDPRHQGTVEYYIGQLISDFHCECVDLIAYSETNNEETKNWMAIGHFIDDEVIDFIQNKKKIEE